MSEYPLEPLNKICDINPDTLSETADASRRYRYIDLSSIKEQKADLSIAPEPFADLPSRARRKVRYNDVLLGTVRPNLKNFALIDSDEDDLLCSTGFAVLRSKEDVSDPRFVFQAINSEVVERQLNALVTGSNYPAVNASQVAELLIPAPPLPEQKKIAEILSGIDNLAKAKGKSLFKCKKLLLAKILEEYSDASRSHLHRISLAELAYEVKRGPSLATNSEKKGIRYITSGNIADGKICLERDNKFLDGFQGIDTCTIKANDLVLNCVNSFTKIGESAIFNCSEHCITGFNNFAITLFPHLCNPRYVYYWTTSTDFKSQVRTIIKDAINQVSFSKKDLREFAIYLPDLAEQDLVASELDSIQRVCDKKNQELIALKNLKSGISSLLLSGRKRVSI